MIGWYGVDLDGTLAEYHPGDGVEVIGNPIPAMVERVKTWLLEGRDVRIFTARVGVTGDRNADGIEDDQAFADKQRELIGAWCLDHIGSVLPVTATKDFRMIALWDDRCMQVVANTGIPMSEIVAHLEIQVKDLEREVATLQSR